MTRSASPTLIFWSLATAVAARSWLLWSTPLVPGMNGGYYLVQARALQEHGRLGIPDLPLTFILQATVAKLAPHELTARLIRPQRPVACHRTPS